MGTDLALGSAFVARDHIRPILFSELTEIELLYSCGLEPISHLLELLFLGEIHALELIQQADIAEISVLGAGD